MTTKTFSLSLALALVGIAGGAGSASAATLFLNSVSPTASMNVQFPTTGSDNTPYVGAINWTFDRSAPDNAGLNALMGGTTLTTFCIEGTQNVFIGQNATFASILTSPATAPQDNVGSLYQMGAGNAATLNQFWDAYYGLAGLSSQNAAAFQLGVWEIVYDGGLSPNFGAGGFKATADLSDPNSALALGQAQSWLTNLGTASPTSHFQLFVLTDPNLQDQLFGVEAAGGISTIPSVPLPAALPMGLALLGSMGAARKMRRK